MSIQTERDKALQFLMSARGQYIVGQALYKAIESMEAVPKEQVEHSNISDMKFLMDTLFPMYEAVREAEKKYKQAKGGQ